MTKPTDKDRERAAKECKEIRAQAEKIANKMGYYEIDFVHGYMLGYVAGHDKMSRIVQRDLEKIEKQIMEEL